MNSRLIAGVVAPAILFLSHVPQAVAKDAPLAPSIAVFGGVQYYSWEEFDQTGARLLRESGPRGTLALSLDNANRRTSGLVYRLYGRAYYGDVVYDGQTQPPASLQARGHSRYLGGLVQLTLGYRFVNVFDGFSLDLLASGGMNRWQRTIHNVSTTTGAPVNGSTEKYRIGYVRLGLGLFHVAGRWSHYVQLGAKRPVYSREDASLALNNGVIKLTVRPQPQVSFYFRWEIARLNERRERTFSVAAYYDSFQFSQSPAVAGAYQPDSVQNVFGVEAGYYFNAF